MTSSTALALASAAGGLSVSVSRFLGLVRFGRSNLEIPLQIVKKISSSILECLKNYYTYLVCCVEAADPSLFRARPDWGAGPLRPLLMGVLWTSGLQGTRYHKLRERLWNDFSQGRKVIKDENNLPNGT